MKSSFCPNNTTARLATLATLAAHPTLTTLSTLAALAAVAVRQGLLPRGCRCRLARCHRLSAGPEHGHRDDERSNHNPVARCTHCVSLPRSTAEAPL